MICPLDRDQLEESTGSGVQSGTFVIDYKNTSGLSKEKDVPPMVAFWSRFDNRSQCLSFSLDRGRTWRPYDKNPYMTRPERDPKVFWYAPGKHWVMLLYGDGKYHVLTSANLLEWKDEKHPIPERECPTCLNWPSMVSQTEVGVNSGKLLDRSIQRQTIHRRSGRFPAISGTSR